jgi:predicted dehydrogenase
MLTTEVVGVAVLGVGRAGLVHARNFAQNIPEARLVGVYDTSKERVDEVANSLNTKGYYDLDEILAEPSLDAVVVAAPTFAHKDLVVAACQAKKAILCEKPMTITPEEADAMEKAVEEANVPFLMGFMRRFDSNFRRAKEILDRGDIGRPLLIKSTGKGPGLAPPWSLDVEKSNGVLGEVNSHDFDSIYWLIESEYKWIFAHGQNLRSPELKEEYPGYYDNVIVTFQLENDVLGTVDGSCPAEYGYDARIEIQGTEGVLFIGDVAQPGCIVCTRNGGVRQETVDSWRNLFREAYIAEDRHFIDCVLNRTKPLVGLKDGRRAMEVVRAGNLSIRKGEKVYLEA